jgi:hypothetical protein
MGIIILTLSCSVSPITVNGRFSNIQFDGNTMSVLVQINTNSGSEDLGGTTMVFSFDTSAVSFPGNPINEVDYTFHNFSDGNYSLATVTRPVENQIWINIDLPYINSNNGTLVNSYPEWTDVVTVIFDVVDQSNNSTSLIWLTSSPFWGIYDADNSTLWENGEFEGFPTSVEPISDLPKDYMLEQNYPNPFNPSTKIKYSVPSLTVNGVEGSVPVTLKVFDILGNEVTTLVNEEKAPGTYEVEFSTHNGISNLSSGIYIYRFESAGFVDTKKMILLK